MVITTTVLPHVPSVMEEAQIVQFLPLTPHGSMSLSRYAHTRLSYIKFWAMSELLFMANNFYWAVIGETTDGAQVYGAGDWYIAYYQPKTLANTCISPYIQCSSGTLPLPLAIQCKSENEVRKVANTLQPLVNSLPDGADHTQLLTVFDNPAIWTLVSDEASFYVVVIGSPLAFIAQRKPSLLSYLTYLILCV